MNLQMLGPTLMQQLEDFVSRHWLEWVDWLDFVGDHFSFHFMGDGCR